MVIKLNNSRSVFNSGKIHGSITVGNRMISYEVDKEGASKLIEELDRALNSLHAEFLFLQSLETVLTDNGTKI